LRPQTTVITVSRTCGSVISFSPDDPIMSTEPTDHPDTRPAAALDNPPGDLPPDLMRRLERDLIDSYDEELELEIDDRPFDADHPFATDGTLATLTGGNPRQQLQHERQHYFRELFRLQGELVKLQDWVAATGHKVVILFEGRDAAGKGGVIKRITQRLNPRVCRVVALPAPNDRERTQWYFQRYAAHLPAAGEIVLFDRSWYNRAGVERVMGFCTEAEVEEFFRSVPEFERMLVRSGVQLVKYWFSITDDEQHLRFLSRIHDPLKQWKLSPMDLESRRRWEAYTKAKEAMLERTHITEAPWWVVQAVDKKKARLNCMAHLLSLMPYAEVAKPPVELPARTRHPDYTRQPVSPQLFVPERY
jgi:polyphosphate kinase